MTYSEALDWLFAQLPIYQNVGKTAYKADLSNITQLCNHLQNPQNQFKSIHIAGTNGKGSTAHMLASVLQESKFKTGLHTSPHLIDFRERNRINGEMMSRAFVIDFVIKNKAFLESMNASFFEVGVAMGFLYFAENHVDIAVVETGLGGRLDATNILKPILSIITNIGLDHQSILGETKAEIAREKAGIIKPFTPVVIGEKLPETESVFMEKAEEMQAPIYFVEDFNFEDLPSDLRGIYQVKNKKTVLCGIENLQNLGLHIPSKAIQSGIENVMKNTGLRGRWETLGTQPLIIADTAHNSHGIEQILLQINQTPHEKLHLVLGFVDDKDVQSILNLFPKDAHYYFAKPNVPRGMTLEKLKNFTQNLENVQYFDSVAAALEKAKKIANPEDMIYVGGSTFVVAEVL